MSFSVKVGRWSVWVILILKTSIERCVLDGDALECQGGASLIRLAQIECGELEIIKT